MSSYPSAQPIQTQTSPPLSYSSGTGQVTSSVLDQNAPTIKSAGPLASVPDRVSSDAHNADLEAVLACCRKLKDQFVDKRIHYYQSHTKIPRWMFRTAGILTVLLSVTLPALAAAVFSHKELVLSSVSIGIAALTGLSSFYRWDRTWSGNSSSQVALEQQVAKWELELTNAQYLIAATDQIAHVYKATNDLLTNAGNIVASESTGFFRGLQFPQQNTTNKPPTSV